MNYKTANLKSLELFEEEDKDGYVNHLLKAVYECESKAGKYEVVYPRINIQFPNHMLPNYCCDTIGPGLKKESVWLDTISNKFQLLPDSKGNYAYTKVIKEYPQKTTLEEIEKKLGYKVELVSKK